VSDERVLGKTRRRADFHSHSFLSDGVTSATDMWNEASTLDHRALALTDHISMEDPTPLLRRLHAEAKAWEGTDFRPVVGVELTKIPARHIAAAARKARRAGAEIVIVHGESITEHVPPGTNRAAIESGLVDVLAHPGLIDPADVELAKANDVVLEISGRRGHALANGHVARLAVAAGATLVVDSDAHSPDQLIPLPRARAIALGSGLPESALDEVLFGAPTRLLKRLKARGRA
jgi:putative hydrolase